MGNASSMMYKGNNNSCITCSSNYKLVDGEKVKLMDLFTVLSNTDKNVMLDYITNSLFSRWNQEFHLFLMLLMDTEVDGIIKDNLVTNLNIINEDKQSTEKLKYIEKMISSIDEEISEFYSVDYNEKNNMINDKIDIFSKNGDFKAYLFLNKLLKSSLNSTNQVKTIVDNSDDMFRRISASIEEAVNYRKSANN
ncbi:hypothetical protein CNPV302 [Canarypox virus]|uniref:SWPV2-ORF288 n=2 Tax=Canarypox virus TaxID=44088 RepID=A0A1V0QGQ2_CNPV|nr:hypothetical protein CNPV302 [Canarypox virus]ARE67540.1 SWPV2-ORF288 [Shearwaterpox virus]QRM15581.1 hypothetical protein [Mudlarkpox virus]QRM15934.1 hypothetical protein [Penguinpox virus 2]QRM16271.1 hypothetical protein [Albatrosspox virus]AAR83648.1 CNPV302 conserved hypothetical protein [Canarypox virus]